MIQTRGDCRDAENNIDYGRSRSFLRRLRDWQEAGVWEKLHQILLARLEAAHQIDWSRASVDSVSVRAKGAKKGGLKASRLARRLWIEAGQVPSVIRS